MTSDRVRDKITHAISCGSMTGTDVGETDADCLGALAMADPLGAVLWRLAGSFDAQSFHKAETLLYNEMDVEHFTVPRQTLLRVCRMAVQEWLAGSCRVCNGRGMIVDADNKRRRCPCCKGSGKWQYPADERMTMLGVCGDKFDKLIPVLDEAAMILELAEGVVTGQVSFQLERKKVNPLKI